MPALVVVSNTMVYLVVRLINSIPNDRILRGFFINCEGDAFPVQTHGQSQSTNTST